jgi:hypothetical protein
MFVHIDESGNSGNNLFDKDQPVLSYGVLSSRWDLDAHGLNEQRAILSKIGADSLHANEIGEAGLVKIADALIELHSRFALRFDYYFIHKPSFAVVTFFNAVFDAGINPAVKWDWYWTPLRFPLLSMLDSILDEDLLRESWRLCLVPHHKLSPEGENISLLLSMVLRRVESSSIPSRLAEVLCDGLRFGIKNPFAMDFGIHSPTALSPNSICFQFVLSAIANRQKIHQQKALQIIVDRQSQFNKAQIKTYDIQSKVAAALLNDGEARSKYLRHPFLAGAREDAETLIRHFPSESLMFSASDNSFGLQVTDCYLWLLNRYIRNERISPRLVPIIDSILSEGLIDGISMILMMNRWATFEAQLPAYKDMTAEQHDLARKMIDEHRQRVKSLNDG